jgi:exodeoxyribonuclease VII small subunit
MSPKKQTETTPQEISKMTFEEAYAELKSVTEHLEGEEIDLENTLVQYQRASELARHCVKLLDSAEERIKVLTECDGVIQATTFESSGNE